MQAVKRRKAAARLRHNNASNLFSHAHWRAASSPPLFAISLSAISRLFSIAAYRHLSWT